MSTIPFVPAAQELTKEDYKKLARDENTSMTLHMQDNQPHPPTWSARIRQFGTTSIFNYMPGRGRWVREYYTL